MMAFATLIAGPTASGKSALALSLAQKLQGAVVNADSMQIYADLQVLSARPNREDCALVTHHLYGFVASHQEYSVGHYLADLAPLIEAARAGGPPLVIVGGTGLYFRALTQGLTPTPDIPKSIKEEWRARAQAGCDLHAELALRDSARAAILHPADTPRLLRAIEVFEATGKRHSEWLKEHPGVPLLEAEEWRGIFLNPPRDDLTRAIEKRFQTMIEAGALEEVRRLDAAGYAANLGVMKAHGVPHLAGFLQGRITLAEAMERSMIDTRAYARRQVIFARKYLPAPKWAWFQTLDDARLAQRFDEIKTVL
jgi:tRNA dimethylallyltransferase